MFGVPSAAFPWHDVVWFGAVGLSADLVVESGVAVPTVCDVVGFVALEDVGADA